MWNVLNCFFKINFDNVYTLMSVLELASVVKEYFLTKERSSTLFIFYGLSVLLVLAFSSSIAPDYWTVHFQDVPYRSDRFILVFPSTGSLLYLHFGFTLRISMKLYEINSIYFICLICHRIIMEHASLVRENACQLINFWASDNGFLCLKVAFSP